MAKQNPTDQNNLIQWELYNASPKRIERFEESENVTIFGSAPAGAHVAEPVWIIWRETVDDYGRVTREYAQEGANNLVWIYAANAFDPQPIDDQSPYHIIIDNNTVVDGMVATLPVANIAVLDPDHTTGDQTLTIISDPAGKFAIAGTTLILADTVYASDVAYPVTIQTEDPDGNIYSQIFAIYVSDPSAPPIEFAGRLNEFDENAAVPYNVETTILTYTVPADRAVRLDKIEVFGKNIAKFSIEVDGARVAYVETHWTKYDHLFEFLDYVVEAAEVVTVKVTNKTNEAQYFNARLLGVQYAP